MMKPLTHLDEETLHFKDAQGETVGHIFERASKMAINTAIYAGRPLLVRGEPGVGKSQLARAAAEALKVPLISRVLHARTETEELFWTFDAVARLAEAQVLGTLGITDKNTVQEHLALTNFVSPGPLWWAFNWDTARILTQKNGRKTEPPQPLGWQPSDGCVVLLDEIDKCDSAVPNGLLEALGSGQLLDPEGQPVQAVHGLPLVIVSTNEERSLPDAFLRRCVVLPLILDDKNPLSLVANMVRRGQAHFGDRVSPEVLKMAAERLVTDRDLYRQKGLSPPGQAEYLDLIRAVVRQTQDPGQQKALMGEIARYVFQKHIES